MLFLGTLVTRKDMTRIQILPMGLKVLGVLCV
jgi:hypothetical protein